MRKNYRGGTVILITFFFCLIAYAGYAQNFEKLIAEGDEYAEKKFDDNKALEVYKRVESLSPGNYEVLWRISRAYVDIGEHLPDKNNEEKDEQLKMYNIALEYANKAINTNADGTMGYLRRAIANGKIALFKGVFTVIGLVKDVRRDLEKAIQLNNADTHQLAVSHYVLGRTHAKVCEKPYLLHLPLGLGWGDREVAASEYEKAIELDPSFIMFRLDAARNYVEQENYQQAKEHLYKIPYFSKNDEDDDKCKTEAAELLNEIKNK